MNDRLFRLFTEEERDKKYSFLKVFFPFKIHKFSIGNGPIILKDPN